jgi:hypothetical protein
MASKLLAPVCNEQKFDNIGNPLSGGTTSVYYQNTLTLASIYANISGSPLTNPITLDSAGRISNGQLYLDLNFGYDIVVKQGTTTLESYAGIVGLSPIAATVSSSSPQTIQFIVSTIASTFTLPFTGDISAFTAVVNGITLNPFTDFIISGFSIILSTSLNVGDTLVVRTSGQATFGVVAPNNISGSITISNGVSSQIISFLTSEVDTNYRIIPVVSNGVSSSAWNPSLSVGLKTTNGFTVYFSSTSPSGTYKLEWLLVR